MSHHQLEKGWNDNVKPPIEFVSEIRPISRSPIYSETVSFSLSENSYSNTPLERNRFELSPKKKPLTAYGSIANSLGFRHHLGTDYTKELEVVKFILSRESVLIKVVNLCDKISHCDMLVQSSLALESELLDTLSIMRSLTLELLENILIWRESSVYYDSHNPKPFLWGNKNYILKLVHDLDFLAFQPSLIASLKLKQDQLILNPLMLLNNLGI